MKTVLLLILNALSVNLVSQASENNCLHPVNLIVNSDFETGNTGFTSTLAYGSNCYTGYYYVGPNMQSKCAGWPVSFVDHTSGAGNFMMVDGNSSYGPQDVWIQDVQVYANSQYEFSFWAKNLYAQFPFPLGFVINGVQVDTTDHISYGSWKRYSTTFTAPATATISLAIRQITAGHYRDFGIDDIFVGSCKDATTGILFSEKLQDDFLVFPNPSSALFTIRSEYMGNAIISIFDILGNRIFDKTPLQHNEQQIDLSNHPKGIYFVEIITDKQETVKKISLQ